MGFVVILVMARVTLRRGWAALLAAFLIFVPLALPKGEFLALDLALGRHRVARAAAGDDALRPARHGRRDARVCVAPERAARNGAGVVATSRTVLVVVLVAGVGVYGFIRSLAGRPAIRDVLAEA